MQRTSMLGQPCLMQSERLQSARSHVSALLSSQIAFAAEVPVADRSAYGARCHLSGWGQG